MSECELIMDLSIIIPVWNEEMKIRQDILNAVEFLNSQNLSGEVIVVDDGSQDNTVSTAMEMWSQLPTSVRIIPCDRHYGKGYAVRQGMLASCGDTVLFIDSGGCVSYSDVMIGLTLIQQSRCDIAQASRYLAESCITQDQPFIRRVLSHLFRTVVKIGFHLPGNITDTQCGLKIYRGNLARNLFKASRCHGFLFDIEIMRFALHSDIPIKEFPIQWKADKDSRLSLIKNFPQFFKEISYLNHHDSKIPK
ncbi:glycosyltransferase [bacterium]